MMENLGRRIAGSWSWTRGPMAAALVVLLLAGCSSAEDAGTRLERMHTLEAAGDLRAAAFELRRALQDAPDHAELRFQFGRVNVLSGRGDAAERELRRALDLGEPADRVMPWLVDALLLQERFAEALTAVSSMIPAEGPVADQWLIRRAEAHLGLDRPAEAAEDLGRLRETGAGQARVLLARAQLAQEQGDLAGALALARKAVKADPADPRSAVMHGWLALRLGRFEEAEQALEAAVASASARINHAELSRAQIFLVEAYLGQDKGVEAGATVDALEELVGDVPEISYLKAVVAYRQGDYTLADRWLQDTLRQRPDHQSARLLLGGVAYALGRYEESVRHLRRHLANVPSNAVARRLLAAAEARLGRHEEAMAVLAPLREAGQDPATASLLAMIGRVASVSGELATAESAFLEALTESPGDAAIRGDLARLHLAQGRYDEAIGELQALIRDGDDTADLLLVRTLLAKGDVDGARRHALALVERDAARPEWHTLLGIVDLHRGDRAQARTSLVQALNVDDAYLPALMTLGRMNLDEGNTASADRYFNAVLRTRPGHALALLGLAESAHHRGDTAAARARLEQAVAGHPESAEPRLWLARFHWRTGDTGAAISMAKEAVAREPGYAPALHLQGELLARAGDLQGAASAYRSLVQAHPLDLGGRFALASIAAQAGRVDEARAQMNEILELAPGDIRALGQAARLELSLGQVDAALNYTRLIREHHPSSPVGWILEGDALAQGGRYPQAGEAYARAHAATPGSLTARRMAQMAERSGAGGEAVRILQDWVTGHPDDVQGMLSLAMLQQQQGRFDEAEALYGRILALDPDQAGALNNLSWLYLGRRDARALETARRAYELQPGAATAHTYGWSLVEYGDVSAGLPLIASAAEQAPIPEVRYRLAVALSRSGDTPAARRVLSELLDEHGQFRERAQAQALYDSLRQTSVE